MSEKKIHLLNSTAMIHAGVYEMDKITPTEFIQAVRDAYYGEDTFEHHIGYENTKSLVEQIAQVQLGEISVKETILNDGDQFLIIQLNTQVAKDLRFRTIPKDNRDLTVEDFDFYIGNYEDFESYISNFFKKT